MTYEWPCGALASATGLERELGAHLDVPAEVPSRTSGQGLYDEPARRILWGFGNERAVYTDLWALELTPPSEM